jgi:maltooligosyltrehalose trehalohydrolase
MTPRFGAHVTGRGTVFRVWAPAQKTVALVLEGDREIPLQHDADGFFTVDVSGVRAGQRYWYALSQGRRPDPASRYQPDGPLGASQVVDSREFAWTDHDWAGVTEPHRQVFYEMHVGTFTTEGTWLAAIERLPSLVDIGVTTIEVMPLAEFTGRFGWGYDGVQLLAPSHLYGTPDDARRFVDAAHAHGLAVILDVVYNHFGPVGNFFPEFSASVLGEPGEWGDSINYDGPGSGPVREFMQENAAYWIREFHFDGLRMDAVNAIKDSSPEHIVSAMCRSAREAAGARQIFIVGECESQDSRLLRGSGAYADGLDAMWNEDWHHSAFVALTGRRPSYFTDYRGTAAELASMARHGFLYQGQWYSWQKKARGGYALGLPASRFVSFLENHDQVANTGVGDRLHQRVDKARWRALTAALLLGPALPLLFQGQEYGSSSPFTYFADHEGDLRDAVAKGRLEFLSQFPPLTTPEMQTAVPDPGDVDAFMRCKLRDEERTADTHLRRLHRDLLRLRREDAVLRDLGTARVRVESAAPTSTLLLLRYLADAGDRLLVVNLADEYHCPMNDALFAPPPQQRWSQAWSSEQLQYGGGGAVIVCDVDPWILPAATAVLLAADAVEKA